MEGHEEILDAISGEKGVLEFSHCKKHKVTSDLANVISEMDANQDLKSPYDLVFSAKTYLCCIEDSKWVPIEEFLKNKNISDAKHAALLLPLSYPKSKLKGMKRFRLRTLFDSSQTKYKNYLYPYS